MVRALTALVAASLVGTAQAKYSCTSDSQCAYVGSRAGDPGIGGVPECDDEGYCYDPGDGSQGYGGIGMYCPDPRQGPAHTLEPRIAYAFLVRAIQGHSLPQVIPERVYTPLSRDVLIDIEMFIHGTDLKAFWNIMRQGQKPGGGGEGNGRGSFHRRRVNMLSRGWFDHVNETRIGIREKCVVHIFYPAERCE